MATESAPAAAEPTDSALADALADPDAPGVQRGLQLLQHRADAADVLADRALGATTSQPAAALSGSCRAVRKLSAAGANLLDAFDGAACGLALAGNPCRA